MFEQHIGLCKFMSLLLISHAVLIYTKYSLSFALMLLSFFVFICCTLCQHSCTVSLTQFCFTYLLIEGRPFSLEPVHRSQSRPMQLTSFVNI